MLDPLDGKDFVLGFQDESSPQTTANTVRVWSLEKPHSVKCTDKIRANIFGFHSINGNSVAYCPEQSKTKDMCDFLVKVREANGKRTVVMIIDNCPIHKAAAVLAAARELDIRFVFLPPYSPQFNPIEQVWRAVKRIVSNHMILCRDHMVAFVTETFYTEVKKESYTKGWMSNFLQTIFLKH